MEHSRLRRGLASLKSKVKAKHAAHQAQKASLSTHTTAAGPQGSHAAVVALKKDTSPSRSTGSSSSSTSSKGHFLKRRRNRIVETGELASPTNMSSALAATVAATGEMAAVVPVIVSEKPEKPEKKAKGIAEGKKIIEIESGVEMLEDMIPPPAPIINDDDKSPESLTAKRDELDLPLETVTTHSSTQYKDYTLKSIKMLYECNDPDNLTPYNSPLLDTATTSKTDTNEHSYMEYLREIIKRAKYLPNLSILGLLLIFVLPLNDFIRGVLACLLGITIVEGLWKFIQMIIEHFTISFRPEKITFHIPDYSKITICEVPAVKEHKTVKSYSVSSSICNRPIIMKVA